MAGDADLHVGFDRGITEIYMPSCRSVAFFQALEWLSGKAATDKMEYNSHAVL